MDRDEGVLSRILPPQARAVKRVHEAELLDALAPGHPEAMRSRRDLRLINLFMGNRAWFRRTLPALLRPGERVLELGAGLGEMGIGLNKRGIPVDGLDLWPRPDGWPANRAWHAADATDFGGFAPYAAVVGNLIFHQFGEDELAKLGASIRRSARVILACEPQRRERSQAVIAAVAPLFRASPVTLHDARVSIAAGFEGDELAAALGIEAGPWRVACTTSILGAYRMVAVRAT